MDAVVKQWREDTPGCAKQIHLNNAGSGLMPRAVLEAITAHLNREANFGGYESADDAEAAVAEAYANVARVLGAQPRNIAVVENSTVAFFQALSAFDFKAGDVIFAVLSFAATTRHRSRLEPSRRTDRPRAA